jgi:hypothetical protein
MSSPLSSFFKKLTFSSDDPTGHVQLGSLEDLQVSLWQGCTSWVAGVCCMLGNNFRRHVAIGPGEVIAAI